MIFDVFERALSQLDSSGEEEFGDNWPDEVKSRIEALSRYYGNQNLRQPDRDLIDYSGLPTQAAYLFMYGIGRAEFTYQLLCRFRKKRGVPFFTSESINVTSVGGGPASEIVGLVRYLDDPANGEEVKEILYDVIDKEGDWENVANLVIDSIQTEIEITPRFLQVDLANPGAADDQTLEYDDMVFMSFFISEVCELPNPKEVKDNLETLLRTMKNGAILFYNDSDAYSFYYYMNRRAGSVKGLIEVSEIQDTIVLEYGAQGETFDRYALEFDKTPHLSSRALSKIFERRIT